MTDGPIYKIGPRVPIPKSWFDACIWCGQPVAMDGPAALMVGAVAHGPLPIDCPSTNGRGAES